MVVAVAVAVAAAAAAFVAAAMHRLCDFRNPTEVTRWSVCMSKLLLLVLTNAKQQ